MERGRAASAFERGERGWCGCRGQFHQWDSRDGVARGGAGVPADPGRLQCGVWAGDRRRNQHRNQRRRKRNPWGCLRLSAKQIVSGPECLFGASGSDYRGTRSDQAGVHAGAGGRNHRRADGEGQNLLLFFLRGYAAGRDWIFQHRGGTRWRRTLGINSSDVAHTERPTAGSIDSVASEHGANFVDERSSRLSKFGGAIWRFVGLGLERGIEQIGLWSGGGVTIWWNIEPGTRGSISRAGVLSAGTDGERGRVQRICRGWARRVGRAGWSCSLASFLRGVELPAGKFSGDGEDQFVVGKIGPKMEQSKQLFFARRGLALFGDRSAIDCPKSGIWAERRITNRSKPIARCQIGRA